MSEVGYHQHRYENLYNDDALLNLSVAYISRISAVPKQTIEALHNLIQQIQKLHPQHCNSNTIQFNLYNAM